MDGFKEINILADIDIFEIIAEVIEENKQDIVDFNLKQLNAGNDANDKSLGEYANFDYKRRFAPVDLLLTGDFRSEIDAIVPPAQNELIIAGFDWKTPILQGKYGNDILGIAESNWDDFINFLEPLIIEKYIQKWLMLVQA